MHSSHRRTSGTVAAKPVGSRARRPRRSRPGLEALEGRQLMSLGSEFLVNTKVDGTQFQTDNASSANGMSVAVWVDSFSGTDHDIHAQLYGATGQRVGSEIVVTASALDDREPAVAMDAQGNFVVAWTTKTTSTNADVLARRFSNTGVALGNAFPVASDPQGEHDPDVAMDAKGNFAVSWTFDSSPTDQDIYVSRFGSNGALLQKDLPIATTNLVEDSSSIAMSPDGRFDVAYRSLTNGTNSDIILN